MSAEAVAVLWAVGMVIAWSGVCWAAGAIWEAKRQQKADLDQRDKWANDYIARNGAA